MTLKGLHSKGWVRRIFSWGWAHYVLVDSGIEGLRQVLHLPAGTQPNTFKPVAATAIPDAFKAERPAGERGGFAPRGGRGGARGGARAGQDRDFQRRPRQDGERAPRAAPQA